MANDVTKKDLQALERNLGKQISDLKKQVDEQQKKIDDNRHEFLKDLEEENKLAVNIKQEHDRRSAEIQNSINVLAKAISDVASKLPK